MSYIINYFHPKLETNIESIPEINLENFKINNNSLEKIAFLKNIKIPKKDIKNMLTKQTLFSKFNMREYAENYEKSNIINKDDDYTIDNIQTILDVVFPVGKNLFLNKKNYVILRINWNQKYKPQDKYKNESNGIVYNVTLRIDLKAGDKYTIKDRIDVSCEDRYTTIQEDMRELFKRKKKMQPSAPALPVAEPVKGGKKKRRKSIRRRKKQTNKKSKKRHHKKTKKYKK